MAAGQASAVRNAEAKGEHGVSMLDRQHSSDARSTLEAARVVWILADIRKAYPNVPRESCWEMLHSTSMPDELMAVLRHLHRTTVHQMRISTQTSELYTLACGLRARGVPRRAQCAICPTKRASKTSPCVGATTAGQ